MGFSRQEYWSGVPSPSLTYTLPPTNLSYCCQSAEMMVLFLFPFGEVQILQNYIQPCFPNAQDFSLNHIHCSLVALAVSNSWLLIYIHSVFSYMPLHMLVTSPEFYLVPNQHLQGFISLSKLSLWCHFFLSSKGNDTLFCTLLYIVFILYIVVSCFTVYSVFNVFLFIYELLMKDR